MTDVLVNNAHVATQPDSGDVTKYGPTKHNASRLFSAGALGDLLYRDTGSATGASWLTGAAGVLAWSGAGVAPTITTTPTLTGTNFTGIPSAAIDATGLTIAETQITDGTLLARLAAAETVAGAWTFSAPILFSNGTAAAPGLALASAPSTGFYKFGTGLSFSHVGTRTVTLGLGFIQIEGGNGNVNELYLGDTVLTASATGMLALSTGDNLRLDSGFIEGVEIADPAAPAANTGRAYFRDTGGKTEFVVRFPTGAIQQIAIEP